MTCFERKFYIYVYVETLLNMRVSKEGRMPAAVADPSPLIHPGIGSGRLFTSALWCHSQEASSVSLWPSRKSPLPTMDYNSPPPRKLRARRFIREVVFPLQKGPVFHRLNPKSSPYRTQSGVMCQQLQGPTLKKTIFHEFIEPSLGF